jgi:hypothetical protein
VNHESSTKINKIEVNEAVTDNSSNCRFEGLSDLLDNITIFPKSGLDIMTSRKLNICVFIGSLVHERAFVFLVYVGPHNGTNNSAFCCSSEPLTVLVLFLSP